MTNLRWHRVAFLFLAGVGCSLSTTSTAHADLAPSQCKVPESDCCESGVGQACPKGGVCKEYSCDGESYYLCTHTRKRLPSPDGGPQCEFGTSDRTCGGGQGVCSDSPREPGVCYHATEEEEPTKAGVAECTDGGCRVGGGLGSGTALGLALAAVSLAASTMLRRRTRQP